MFSNNFTQKNPSNFVCNNCDFNTCNKKDFIRHTQTKKHISNVSQCVLPNFTQKNPFACTCGKTYKDNSGLWRHKKKCTFEVDTNSDSDSVSEHQPSDKELIVMLIKENSEFKNIMMKVLENGTTSNSHNNTNSHNKSFNLQFFLNETCKNAMNITDFVDSLQLQLSDLEKVGEVGYIEGISSIIIKKLNAMDVTERPIHCTDKKRETMYIRDEDKWEKEDEKRDKMHKMVKKVAYKNIDLISSFREKYPDFKKINSKYSDQFNKIIIESMDGKEYDKEEKIYQTNYRISIC